MPISHTPKAGDVLTGAEYEAADHHVIALEAADIPAHVHAGEDITSGTVADGRVASTLARDSEVTTAVSDHAAAADPHTGYLKESDFGGVDFLVGTATALTTNEIVVGTAPGGELGGTWASPTVDATHSGSTHAATQAAAEATAASALATHAGAADPHTGYVREADANWVDLTDGGATTLHSHAGGPGGEAFPVGAVFIAVVSTDPATLLGYGTWEAFGAGRVLVGRDSGDTDFDTAEETGGAKTKAISAHAGTAVADHTVTQPTAAGESAHTHTYTQVVNHVHVQTVNSATTGGLSGYAPDTSTNTPATSGYSTANPTGGVASGTTAAGSSHTHTMSGSAVSAHSVTQPSGHSDLNVVQPYIVVYMWKRTA